MNNWFTVSVRYTKEMENGTFRRVNEPYLIAAVTHGDAEARIHEELGSLIRGEFIVTGVKITELHDIFAYDDADVWFKAKIQYTACIDETETSKKVTQTFLVSAHSVKQAYDRIKESLSTLLTDFQIPSISISPIVEIFPYKKED